MIDYNSLQLPPNATIKFENDSQTGTIIINKKKLIEFQSGLVSKELINIAIKDNGQTLKLDTTEGHIILIKSNSFEKHHQLSFYDIDMDNGGVLFKDDVGGFLMTATDLSENEDSIVIQIFNSVVPDNKALQAALDRVNTAMEKYRKKHPEEYK